LGGGAEFLRGEEEVTGGEIKKEKKRGGPSIARGAYGFKGKRTCNTQSEDCWPKKGRKNSVRIDKKPRSTSSTGT